MDLSAYDFDLPESRIALRPAEPQDSARMLVVHGDGRLEDADIRDLPGHLRAGDTLVFNDTRVLPAALRGIRPARDDIGRNVVCDINLFEEVDSGQGRWLALARPGRRLKPGDRVHFAADFSVVVSALHDGGVIELCFDLGADALRSKLEAHGAMPLPPYIARRRKADARDRETYQTRFAGEEAKSVAAPTAGLHFTDSLMQRIDGAGLRRETVRLHVGAGTFELLDGRALSANRLHQEWRRLTPDVADRLNAARAGDGRIIPVGTTALRTLESCVDDEGRLHPQTGPTDIFLKPGDKLHTTDGLVTNFHLPRSSLFMLVCALMGTAVMQAAYAHAIAGDYRFYSYGDACLLLP